MRGLLRSLTLRGRCVLAAGVTAGLSGIVLQERDLVRIAIVLMTLPIVATAIATRSRFRLTCRRHLVPPRVSAGESSRVVLRLENVSRLPTGLLLLEDTVPYALGGRPRVVVDRLAPRRPVEVGYDVHAELRGRYTIGPLTVRLLDPFGLCELPRSFADTETLVVSPTVVPLPRVRLTGEWAGAGHSTARSVATSGEDDAATREYRQGDDLRRIHWRTTARRGELTVRREEQPWQSRGAILLDTRAVAHAGDGPSSSFEWSVSAAASIGTHLAHSGFGVRLVTDTGDEVSSAGRGGFGFDGALLDGLAVVRESGNRSLQLGVGAMRQHGGEGLLIAIVGALAPQDAEQLARVRSGHASVGVALLVDVTSWDGLSSSAAAEARDRLAETRNLLGSAGWRTLIVEQGHSLPDLWSAAGKSVAAEASRSVVAPTAPGLGVA